MLPRARQPNPRFLRQSIDIAPRSAAHLRKSRLHTVIDSLQTDSQARILRAEDDRGNWTSYQYSPEGMLAQVSSSSGEVRSYVYDGALMIQVLDGHGQVLVRNWYDGGQLRKQQFADGSLYLYYFESSPGGRYRKTATVTLPGGVKKRIEVESLFRRRLKRGD